MKHFRPYFIYIMCLLVGALLALPSCRDDKKDDTSSLPGHPKEVMNRTLIIYMACENSLARYANVDSLEMAQGLKTVPSDTRVVLYIDDHRSSRICVGTSTTPFQLVRTYDENICSTDSAGMERVLTDIFADYPAEHYGLVFWSHASGWVFQRQAATRGPRRSFGIDNGRRVRDYDIGREMNIPTLARVLSHYPHTDFIFFDACFMQCVEVAYELRKVTDYVIGSPAEIPGDGAPYELMMRNLCEVPADLEGMLDAYYEYYTEGRGALSYRGVELSMIQTDRLERLAEVTKPLVTQLFADRAVLNCDTIQRYNPYRGSQYYTDFYDMQHLFYSRFPSEVYNLWLTEYDMAVPYALVSEEWFSAVLYKQFLTIVDMDHVGLVSMFVPGPRYDELGWTEDYHQLEWYKAVGFDKTGW